MTAGSPGTGGTPPITRRRGIGALGRLLRVVLIAAGGFYVALTALLYIRQAELIFPGHVTQGDPAAAVKPPPGAELVTLTASTGDRVAALYGGPLAPGGNQPQGQAPVLIYFYGNGMCLADTIPQLEAFRRLGTGVLLVEYPGYGLSSGRPSERGCYAAADAGYDYLLSRGDVDPARIYAGGFSLGGAVAIDLAARRPVAGVATFCTMTSMTDMASRQYPFVPVRLLLRHRFENERKLPRVRSPLLLGYGTEDELVPVSMSERLAAAAGGPVTPLPIEGATHNTFFSVGGQRVLDAMAAWLHAR